MADDAGKIGASARGESIQVFLAKPGTPRRPRIARGDGIYMWDEAGRRYLDVSSGPVANNIGHGNPRVIAAMQRQAQAAAFAFPGAFESEANERLADLLTQLAGPGFERAFFVSGGSEATESAIKFARQYAITRGEPSRWKVVSREPSYHGSTLGAMALSGDHHQHEVFGPMLQAMPKIPTPFTYRIPAGHSRESYARHCAAALEERILMEGPDTVLAFIMEPIGGLSTGALVPEDVYFTMVREICDRYGVLLIFDEVMCGAGRTGRFLAAEHWPDARPDIVVLAKGVAAGYTPMGCVLASAEMVRTVAEAGGFMHGFTYFANPLSCAIAHAVLEETVERGLIDNAAARGAELKARLEETAAASPLVGDVRGRGLLLAMELVADKESRRQIPLAHNAPALFQAIAMEMGLAVYARRTSRGMYGDWLMITPPLIVTREQVEEIASGLAEAFKVFEKRVAALGL